MLYTHDKILSAVDGYVNGVKCSGSRSFFLKGDIVKLNQALMAYGLDYLTNEQP